VHGIAAVTAARLLITAGDSSDRIHSEAAFAMLYGAAPTGIFRQDYPAPAQPRR
jgi:hypothetical protein